MIVGSYSFFNGMDGYVVHDIDELIFSPNVKKNMLFRRKGSDVIMLQEKTKEGYLDEIRDSWPTANTGLLCGKFLCKEFIDKIGFTIEDLKRIKPHIDAVDEKHLYLKSICESYIENNCFELSDEQRKKAFEIYKNARKDVYKR